MRKHLIVSKNYRISEEVKDFPYTLIKGTGEECRRVECKSAQLWGEMVKELSDGVTET